MDSQVSEFFTQTYRKPYRPAEIRAAEKERESILSEQTDAYSEFISGLAERLTNTPEEAAAALREMKADIKRCSEKLTGPPANEERLISGIAFRRLLDLLK